MRTRAIPVLLFTYVAFAVAFAQPQDPGVRNGHSMAYDPVENMIVLFGGADEKQVRDDTWICQNKKWIQVAGPGPSARTFANLVFDSKRRCLVLFGGNRVLFGDSLSGNTVLNDTWVFAGRKWQRVSTKHSPPARAEAAMCYDETNHHIILFGGYSLPGDSTRRPQRLGDTWAFDGSDWKLVASQGPGPRSGCVMTFDENLKQPVLFGGNIRSAKNQPMWRWNGNGWINIPTKAEPIYNSNMVFDASEKILLRYGGYNGQARVDTTWYLPAGDDWRILPTSARPPARNHAALVYNTADGAIYLYGGHDGENIFGDMWKLQKGKWTCVLDRHPLRRVANNH